MRKSRKNIVPRTRDVSHRERGRAELAVDSGERAQRGVLHADEVSLKCVARRRGRGVKVEPLLQSVHEPARGIELSR